MTLAVALAQELRPVADPIPYWQQLTQGARLPYDDLDVALEEVDRLIAEAEARDLDVEPRRAALATAAQATLARHELEEEIALADEVVFASAQRNAWREILGALLALAAGRPRRRAGDDEGVTIPSGEAPAYLEWATWRALLAINEIRVPPDRVRRFKVDRDFLPVGNAPGGGPDLVAIFDEFVLVVEVTLLTSGRQEAAEGYPVRQHVAAIVEEIGAETGLPVYGLFLAPVLDQNTLATFRLAQWHGADGTEHRLNIVPLTISQFTTLFASMFEREAVDHLWIQRLLDSCLAHRDTSRQPRDWEAAICEQLGDVLTALAP